MTRDVPGELGTLGRGRADRSSLELRASSTAFPRRNRRTMRAGARMTEESTNLVRSLERKDMLELAGLLLDFRFAVHCEAVGKKPFGEAMSTNDAASPFAPAGRKLYDQSTVANRSGYGFERVVARIHERLVIVRMRRMRRGEHESHLNHFLNRKTHRQRTVHFHALDFRDFAVLGQHPQFFEHLIELLFVGHGKHFLRLDLAVMELDAPVGQAR